MEVWLKTPKGLPRCGYPFPLIRIYQGFDGKFN